LNKSSRPGVLPPLASGDENGFELGARSRRARVRGDMGDELQSPLKDPSKGSCGVCGDGGEGRISLDWDGDGDADPARRCASALAPRSEEDGMSSSPSTAIVGMSTAQDNTITNANTVTYRIDLSWDLEISSRVFVLGVTSPRLIPNPDSKLWKLL
jgi:hypothetical protein